MKYALAILVVLAAAAGWFFHSRADVARPAALQVFFTGDTSGRLVPCGCFIGQMGGMTRLDTALSNKCNPGGIKVDIGDAIAGPADFQAIQYQYMLRAFAAMGYDALNIGQREAQLSAAQLTELRKNSPVTLLSANLLDESTGLRIFDASKIIHRNGRKIAIVGVVDPACMNGGAGPGIRIAPMETVLEELLPPLRKQGDAILLLAFTDENGLDRLAQQFYEANLILGGKVSQPSQRLIKENHSYILYTANESRAVGIVNITLGRHFSAGGFQMLMLDSKIPQDPAIEKLANQYRDQIRDTRLNIDDARQLEADEVPGIRNSARYVGTESCVPCHKSAAAIWEHTAHSGAFASLRGRQADADPNCIGCHTVGFGTPSGYNRQLHGSRLANVGCESCHGPGSLHVEQRRAGTDISFKFRPLAAGDCKQCHHGEFSPPFDWDASWAKIKHGSEPNLSINP